MGPKLTSRHDLREAGTSPQLNPKPPPAGRPLEILNIERVLDGGAQRALTVHAKARESFVPEVPRP